jgi:twitching motility protein PilI
MARAERLDLRAFQQELSERLKHKTAAEVGNLRLALECAGASWLVRLADTGEVLPLPAVTPVPLTKPWFVGIANVRGALHGVIDFTGFVNRRNDARGPVAPQARLVLLGSRFSEIHAGLLVDRVLGLRNLADFTPDDAPDAGARSWAAKTWHDGSGNTWRELDMGGLAADPEFMQVGA